MYYKHRNKQGLQFFLTLKVSKKKVSLLSLLLLYFIQMYTSIVQLLSCIFRHNTVPEIAKHVADSDNVLCQSCFCCTERMLKNFVGFPHSNNPFYVHPFA